MLTMTAADGLSTVLPGTITVERGTFDDYAQLAHFHYAPGRPATWAGVWRAVWRKKRGGLSVDCGLLNVDGGTRPRTRRLQPSTINHQPSTINNPSRVIAIAILSYPTPSSRARDAALQLAGPRYGEKLAFINRHVRTISRVIVHPQFRSLGIASQLVRLICEQCPTRYVEAIAAMGEVHPFFERGGMRKIGCGANGAAYFIFDRERGEGGGTEDTEDTERST